jgi:hypothetical protein
MYMGWCDWAVGLEHFDSLVGGVAGVAGRGCQECPITLAGDRSPEALVTGVDFAGLCHRLCR